MAYLTIALLAGMSFLLIFVQANLGWRALAYAVSRMLLVVIVAMALMVLAVVVVAVMTGQTKVVL